MAEIAFLKLEVLELLHGPQAKLLYSYLSEQRLRRREGKSKTIESGRTVYETLVNTLYEAGYFHQFGHDDKKLYEILLNRDTIEDAMESLAEGLNISSHFGPAIFYMILGWITAQLKLTDVDHYDIVTSYSLTDSNDGKLAQIFKYVVHMVICMAGQKLLSDESVQHYDNDLRWLLHNGTVSGIYNRLNMLTKCSANFYGVYTDTVIISTIAMELHKLSRSRQVTFTRLIQHITDNLIGSANPGYNTAPRKQNQRLWNLLSQGVIKSGIKQLTYDNISLLRSMRLLGREFDIMPLAKVLAQGTTSHVNDLEDFRKNCDYMSAVCALKKHGITWDYFDTFNLQRDNMGVILLDRNLF